MLSGKPGVKSVLKILKITGLTLGGIILILLLSITAFVNMSPQIGGTPPSQQAFSAAANYSAGKFQNQIPTSMRLGFRNTVSLISDFFFKKAGDRRPEGPLPVEMVDSVEVSNRAADLARVTWFGHSAVLLEIDGRKIFLDPMLGQLAGPVPFVSPKRYNETLPIEIEALPFIDVVLISHDHYDHLDYGSVIRLKSRVGRFIVPLGVGAHLTAWGIEPDRITELNWWEQRVEGDLNFVCTPARHFSGRGFTRNNTLWASWVIQAGGKQLYFSGDSGYGPHFKEIGARFGPFDFVMMECGQYNELWSAIHMMPEETAQAAIDVKGALLMPIHWGAFTLAMHPWTDPVSRVVAAASKVNLRVATPKIGEPVSLNGGNIPDRKWW